MIAYLDALLAALAVRDQPAIRRLLDHPLARILGTEARGEAESFATGDRDPLAAPLRVMQLRHQAVELLREAPVAADQPEEPLAGLAPIGSGHEVAARDGHGAAATVTRRPPRLVQMELPLSA